MGGEDALPGTTERPVAPNSLTLQVYAACWIGMTVALVRALSGHPEPSPSKKGRRRDSRRLQWCTLRLIHHGKAAYCPNLSAKIASGSLCRGLSVIPFER